MGRFLRQTGTSLAPGPLGILIPIMLLTKTTALVLLPAVLWLLWKKKVLRAILAVSAMAAAAIGIYLFIVLRSRYADDYHYFFDINALAEVELANTGSYLLQLLHHGMWIDRILYPAGLAVLLLSLAGCASYGRTLCLPHPGSLLRAMPSSSFAARMIMLPGISLSCWCR